VSIELSWTSPGMFGWDYHWLLDASPACGDYACHAQVTILGLCLCVRTFKEAP